MAFNFQGDRAVGVLNDRKNIFNTNDLFRVYDAGILVPGGVSVDHGDFVSWDGTKWVREADVQYVVETGPGQMYNNIAEAFSTSSIYANGASGSPSYFSSILRACAVTQYDVGE